MQANTRVVPRIDISNFEQRYEDISEQIITAAKNSGFFILYNQESPSTKDIINVFQRSKEFFAQSDDLKLAKPFVKLKNTGYEKLSQIRPSTLTIDQKESLQLQYHRKDDYWPLTLDASWNKDLESFISKTQNLSLLILTIFEKHLNLPPGYLKESHDIGKPTAQSTLRLLHYFEPDNSNKGLWRAGPHTDFDCLTLLFQQTSANPSGDGLEICPGRETFTTFGYGDEWTPIPAQAGEIVVNIGDMLMSWSDDEFKSTFHRVRFLENIKEDRYSVVWFNQLNTDVEIQGPQKKYPITTGKQFIEDAMKRNYELLKESS